MIDSYAGGAPETQVGVLIGGGISFETPLSSPNSSLANFSLSSGFGAVLHGILENIQDAMEIPFPV